MSLLTDLKNRNKTCVDIFKKTPEGLLAHKSYSGLEWGHQIRFIPNTHGHYFANATYGKYVSIAVK